jgi:hypothetical protein
MPRAICGRPCGTDVNVNVSQTKRLRYALQRLLQLVRTACVCYLPLNHWQSSEEEKRKGESQTCGINVRLFAINSMLCTFTDCHKAAEQYAAVNIPWSYQDLLATLRTADRPLSLVRYMRPHTYMHNLHSCSHNYKMTSSEFLTNQSSKSLVLIAQRYAYKLFPQLPRTSFCFFPPPTSPRLQCVKQHRFLTGQSNK